MEEAGRIRRGYFVGGLGGAQFALPAAVDLLRSFRDGPRRDDARDPRSDRPGESVRRDREMALRSSGRSQTRTVGARVVLVDGCAARTTCDAASASSALCPGGRAAAVANNPRGGARTARARRRTRTGTPGTADRRDQWRAGCHSPVSPPVRCRRLLGHSHGTAGAHRAWPDPSGVEERWHSHCGQRT